MASNPYNNLSGKFSFITQPDSQQRQDSLSEINREQINGDIATRPLPRKDRKLSDYATIKHPGDMCDGFHTPRGGRRIIRELTKTKLIKTTKKTTVKTTKSTKSTKHAKPVKKAKAAKPTKKPKAAKAAKAKKPTKKTS